MDGGTANSMLGYVLKSGKLLRYWFCKLSSNLYFTVVRPVLCAETVPVVVTMGSSAARAARWGKGKTDIFAFSQVTISSWKLSLSCSRGSSSGQWERTRGTSAGWQRIAMWTRIIGIGASTAAFKSASPWACAVTVRIAYCNLFNN